MSDNDKSNIRSRITEIRKMRLGDIDQGPDNWRLHPESQVAAFLGVVKEVGWFGVPLIYWSAKKNNWAYLDGNMRGDNLPDFEADVAVTDFTDEDIAEPLATYDPLAAAAIADREKLGALLHNVKSGEAGVQALLAELAEREGVVFGNGKPPEDPGPQIDKAAELQEKWQVQTGDLWVIPSKTADGEHRVICGDCTDAAVVSQLDNCDICFTSPPYNAGVSAKLRGNTSIGDNLYRDAYDDNKSQSEWLELMRSFTDVAFDITDYVFVNLQILAGNKRALIEYWHEFICKFADVAIWDKRHAAPAAAQRVMDSRFEFVLVFSKDGTRAIGTREFRGMVHNVYEGQPQRHNEFASSHAATFPVDLPEHFIEIFTNGGDKVYEPFLGTGTTIVACERLGRLGRGIEIEPKYVSVTLERLQGLGLSPQRVER